MFNIGDIPTVHSLNNSHMECFSLATFWLFGGIAVTGSKHQAESNIGATERHVD